MDDIFDEADEILSEGSQDVEEKSFNESELQDIMSEIEDLEKEFETQTVEMTLQEKIDAELASEVEEVAPVAVVAAVEAKISAPVSQVLSFEKVAAVPAKNNSEVSFAAHGQMSLNLDFKVGQENAKLCIDPVKGLIVTLSGVELCINEDTGCTVSMENGMKFTIPLSSQVNSLKKKAV